MFPYSEITIPESRYKSVYETCDFTIAPAHLGRTVGNGQDIRTPFPTEVGKRHPVDIVLTASLTLDSRSSNAGLFGSFKSSVNSLSNVIVVSTLIPEAKTRT